MLTLSNHQLSNIIPSSNNEGETESVRLRITDSRSQEPSQSIHEPVQTQIPVFTNSPEANFIPQENIFNDEMIKEEQASFLRKAFVLFFGIIIWMILSINEVNTWKKIEKLGFISFVCLTFCTFENCMFFIRQYLAKNNYQESLFNALDGVLAVHFFLSVFFWNQEITSRYWLVTSPLLYLILTFKYIQISTASDKSVKILMRLCSMIQVSLLTAKFLGSLASISWTTLVWPLGLYLIGYQIYGSYILIRSSLQLFKYVDITNLSFIRGSLRTSCNVVYHGLTLVAFGIFITLFNQRENKKIEGPFGIFFLAAKCWSGIFLGYALVLFKILRGLDPAFREDSGNNAFITKQKLSKKKYSLVRQDGSLISNFLKISPTYFVKADGQEKEEEVKLIEREEALCYLCEESEPNIILMNCGHGGMCKKCVLLSMKKNHCCMQCREPVRSIYQIKKEDKNSGFVEACEAFTIVG